MLHWESYKLKIRLAQILCSTVTAITTAFNMKSPELYNVHTHTDVYKTEHLVVSHISFLSLYLSSQRNYNEMYVYMECSYQAIERDVWWNERIDNRKSITNAFLGFENVIGKQHKSDSVLPQKLQQKNTNEYRTPFFCQYLPSYSGT